MGNLKRQNHFLNLKKLIIERDTSSKIEKRKIEKLTDEIVNLVLYELLT